MGCDVRAHTSHVQSARVIVAVDGIQYSVNIFIFRMAPWFTVCFLYPPSASTARSADNTEHVVVEFVAVTPHVLASQLSWSRVHESQWSVRTHLTISLFESLFIVQTRKTRRPGSRDPGSAGRWGWRWGGRDTQSGASRLARARASRWLHARYFTVVR